MIPYTAFSAENVNIGKNIIFNLESGIFIHAYTNTAKIAPL